MNRYIQTLLAGFLAFIGLGPTNLRRFTTDVAFTFRMGAGFPGDVNRTHPFGITPGLQDGTTPVRNYGDACLIAASGNGIRGVAAGDGSATAINIYGALVRPFPTQQRSGGDSSALGAAAAPTTGVIDVCEMGYIMVKIPAGVAVVKGGQAFIWCAVTSGANIQGSFAGAASSTNTVPVLNARFNGPADANGNVELEIWPAR